MEWYQVKCIFEKLEQARAITKKIEDITDLGGWEELLDEAKVLINKLVGAICFLSRENDFRIASSLFSTVYLLNPLENLRSYVNNRPPMVIFTASISTVAIAFLTIGYFFKIKEIKSPEMTEDWNTFLLRFNEIDF